MDDSQFPAKPGYTDQAGRYILARSRPDTRVGLIIVRLQLRRFVMKLVSAYLIATVLVLSGTVVVNATSKPPRRLTPNNLPSQRHRIAISADDGGGGKRFHVTISAKNPKTLLEVEWGYLSVCEGERLVCGCRIHAQQTESKVVFEFVVAPTVLEKSRFSFSAATATAEERKKMPAGAGWENYEFLLQTFATNGDGSDGNVNGNSK
jgi:hypothetical protein